MPTYTTTIKLMSGTKEDYESLSAELKKKSFRDPEVIRTDEQVNQGLQIRLSTVQSNLFDVTTSISAAASHTGKKFTFVVRKEKAL